MNASFKLIHNLLLTVSIQNLTKPDERTYLGKDTEAQVGSNNHFGRIAPVGVF